MTFKSPPDLHESQVMPIRAYSGMVRGGSLDGCNIVVTAWKPTPAELKALNMGQPLFLSCIGGLPPHFPSVDFDLAIAPA